MPKAIRRATAANVGSIRVLERSGFVRIRDGTDRRMHSGAMVSEVMLRPDG